MVIATFVFLGWRANGVLRKRTHKRDRRGNLGHLATGTGGRQPRADPTHQFAHASGGSELARDLIAALQEPGDDRLTAPAAIQADLGPFAFLHGIGIFSTQAEPTLHRVDRFLQDRQTLHFATRDDRFPDGLLRVGGSHPHQFAPSLGAVSSHIATLRPLCMLACR
ncbi:MAG: hypothetical protein ACXWPG_07470 [Ktedonobacteraceae bacterium]